MTRNSKLAPSVRKSRSILGLSAGIGLLVGAALFPLAYQAGRSAHSAPLWTIFSAAPINPMLATIMLVGLALIGLLTIWYYRTIDEHDRSTQEYASLVGLNTYGFLFFSWGIAAKGNFAPPVSHGAVFVAVMATFVITWLWRRYR